MNNATTMLDEQTGTYSQGYTLDRLLKIGQDKVRIRVKRDSYQAQSYAVAEVFTTSGWTNVLDEPASCWYETTLYGRDGSKGLRPRTELGPIADRLAQRLEKFLTA